MHNSAEAEIVATQAATTVEADYVHDDGYFSATSSTFNASISSSICNYAFENSRRYHKFREGSYAFPNDESEQAKEDMEHTTIVNFSGGKLHFAPIGDNPQNVIDNRHRNGNLVHGQYVPDIQGVTVGILIR